MSNILRWLDKHLEEVILVLLLMAMSVIMIIQVFSRYVLNNSLSWSEELVRYLFIWTAFLSVAYAIKCRISIKIDILFEILPEGAKKILYVVCDIFMLIFCLLITFYGFKYLGRSIEMAQVSAALQLPMKFIQSAPLIGFALASIRALQSLIRDISGKTDESEKEEQA